MAKALICDRCKRVFAGGATETTTGKWTRKEVEEGEKTYRLVTAGWEVRTDLEKAAERGGRPLDLCITCITELISKEESNKSVEFYNLVEQAKYELELLHRVKTMGRQYHHMKEKLALAERYLVAAEAGFDPFYPASSWYWGFIKKPAWWSSRDLGASYFERAMPLAAIEAYDKALTLKVFDTFTVHGPDSSLFHSEPPKPRFIDPVLMGWIGSHADIADRLRHHQGEAKGFLIAQWDIGKDLLAGGLIALPEGQPTLVTVRQPLD